MQNTKRVVICRSLMHNCKIDIRNKRIRFTSAQCKTLAKTFDSFTNILILKRLFDNSRFILFSSLMVVWCHLFHKIRATFHCCSIISAWRYFMRLKSTLSHTWKLFLTTYTLQTQYLSSFGYLHLCKYCQNVV